MPLTNAQKQAAWRKRRNAAAKVLYGTPEQIADGILRGLGVDKAAKVWRALKTKVAQARKEGHY